MRFRYLRRMKIKRLLRPIAVFRLTTHELRFLQQIEQAYKLALVYAYVPR